MGNYETLNELLVTLFRDVMDIEQKVIITPEAMWNEAGDSRIGGSYIFLFQSGAEKRMGITPGSTGR